ncbi:hypothetical protein KEM60_02991 [Austwickia sp. TVS 96-490-7B]|uniref:HD-GYP domain-containing protein n=1 Tax=Austwickia sp. TVS 96-490-7B TaxID=2830843 RepID=UPI001C592526|nr:HD domain-containing phosphohydrolase [Austwickia sp. TVS 96-490-7B]MBW3086762.1 hypothetical protein [Austwickia sp. TVS 96-490-7B]
MNDSASAGRSPRSSWGPFAYVVALAVIWISLIVIIGDRGAVRADHLAGLGVLFGLAVVSVMARDTTGQGSASSFTTVILLACLALYGPTSAGVLGLLIALIDRTYGWSIVPMFNGLMMGVMALCGGIVFEALNGGHLGTPGGGASRDVTFLFVGIGAPLLAADLVMCLLNVLILSGMVGIDGGHPRTVIWGAVRELVPLYLGYGIIGFLFVVLWEPAGVGPVSVLLIAAPLTIARFVYVQYGDEVRARGRILSIFLAAADSPDGKVSVHARRVDELCQMMAGVLGLTEPQRRSLSYAATLHDLGMKGVLRETDASRGGRAPYTNMAALLTHPELASRVVSGVDFLDDAAQIIRWHHERVDGRGYPDGLVGDLIPLPARILAVADAFDALTTTRGDREALGVDAALAELRLAAGGQLDPVVLDALAQALRTRSWSAHEDRVVEATWLWDHHALPAMSDVIADEVMVSRDVRAEESSSESAAPGGERTVGTPIPPSSFERAAGQPAQVWLRQGPTEPRP